MSRFPFWRRLAPVVGGLLLIALANAQPPAPSPPTTKAVRVSRVAATRQQLIVPVDFRGFDPDTKLDDAVNYLSKTYGVPFEVNEEAFKDAGFENVGGKELKYGALRLNIPGAVSPPPSGRGGDRPFGQQGGLAKLFWVLAKPARPLRGKDLRRSKGGFGQ